MLCVQTANNKQSNCHNESDIFHNVPMQQSSGVTTSLPTNASGQLLDSLPPLTNIESSIMPPLLVTSVSQEINSDLLQATTRQQSSSNISPAFQISSQSPPYSVNCETTSVSAWLTNSIFKTSPQSSDNVQTSGALPPVTEIYSASCNNGGLRLLGIGPPSEVVPNVISTGSNELELNPSTAKKLLQGTTASSNFGTTESLALANTTPSVSSPFQTSVNNKIRISPTNLKQSRSSFSENSLGQTISLSSPLTSNVSCLNSNSLLPLVMNGQGNNAGVSSSNSGINGSHDFDLVNHGSRISTHMPLSHLETLIQETNGVIDTAPGPLLSPLPVSGNMSPRHDILNSVNVSTSRLTQNNATLTDIGMPNSSLSSNAVSLQLLCLQTPIASPSSHNISRCDDVLNSAIEEIMCFKCKFCTFISLNKSQVVSHIKLSHVKSSEIIQLLSSSSEPKSMDRLVTMNNAEREVCTNLLPSAQSESADTNFANLNPSFLTLSTKTSDSSPHQVVSDTLLSKEPICGSENHFFCGKCRKGFATLKECKHHLANDHSVKSNRIRLEHMPSQRVPLSHSLGNNLSKNRTVVKPKPNTGGNMEKTYTTSYSTQENGAAQKQADCIPSKSGKKSGNLMKKALHIKKLNNEDGGKLVLNVRKKGELSSLQKAWKKKKKKEQGSYICEYKGCNVRFRITDNLEYHKRCHIPGTSAFACPECGIRFEHWGSTAGHLWRHHVVEMELYACDICSYRTYSLTKLENLHKRIHRDERPYICDVCGKAFKTSKQLKNHKAFHIKKGRNALLLVGECTVCYRRFADKRMLRSHLDTVHNKLRPFLCNYCGYSASSKSTLKMHMRQHTGEKPFACELCNYCTSDHNSLRRHKMRHSGEKPYKCPYCPYACIQASTYKTHLKNKHPGQDEGLLFSCTQCSFRTIKQENYLTHVGDHQLDALNQSNRGLPDHLDISSEKHRSENLPLVEAMAISLFNGDKDSVLATNSLVTSGHGSVFSLC